jgi:group I intron endonuclease
MTFKTIDPNLKFKQGIYKITCKNHTYIGSSKNLFERLNKHLYCAKANTHQNGFFQRVFNKYKEDSFCIEILSYCDNYTKELLVLEEYFYIKIFNPNLNLCLNPVTTGMTEESKKKVSIGLKKYFASLDEIPFRKKIYVFDEYGNLLHKFKSIKECTKVLKISTWKHLDKKKFNNKMIFRTVNEITPEYILECFNYYIIDKKTGLKKGFHFKHDLGNFLNISKPAATYRFRVLKEDSDYLYAGSCKTP